MHQPAEQGGQGEAPPLGGERSRHALGVTELDKSNEDERTLKNNYWGVSTTIASAAADAETPGSFDRYAWMVPSSSTTVNWLDSPRYPMDVFKDVSPGLASGGSVSLRAPRAMTMSSSRVATSVFSFELTGCSQARRGP